MSVRAFVYVWQFEVAPNRLREFEQTYGSKGPWVDLFRKARGYIGTDLLKDQHTVGRYLTIDRWESPEAHAAFRETFSAEYEAIDQACESFTISEQRIGEFEVPD